MSKDQIAVIVLCHTSDEACIRAIKACTQQFLAQQIFALSYADKNPSSETTCSWREVLDDADLHTIINFQRSTNDALQALKEVCTFKLKKYSQILLVDPKSQEEQNGETVPQPQVDLWKRTNLLLHLRAEFRRRLETKTTPPTNMTNQMPHDCSLQHLHQHSSSNITVNNIRAMIH